MPQARYFRISRGNVPIRIHGLSARGNGRIVCTLMAAAGTAVCMALHEIATPYLVLVGDTEHPVNAKTGFGLRDWMPGSCVGQLRFSPRAVDLGLADMSPAEAAEAGARTLVIGIAPPGGQLPQSWHPTLVEALEAGLDLAAGLHQRLAAIPEIAGRAAALGRAIHDVRHSDARFAVGTGLPRSGRRLLTVGTDCALGKKYTALAIARAMRARGIDADFRATGQTGILISGSGVAIDAVVADFLAGAAESLSPAAAAGHWDVIEGQGSLFHPSYAAVTLGLVHGSQPDAMVLCHDPLREAIHGLPHMPLPSLDRAMDGYVAAARLTNPAARFVGISLNTARMAQVDALALIADTGRAFSLPCFDPVRTGVEPLLDHLETCDAP